MKKHKIYTILYLSLGILFFICLIIANYYEMNPIFILILWLAQFLLMIKWRSIQIVINPEELLITTFEIKKNKKKELLSMFRSLIKKKKYRYYKTINKNDYKTIIFRKSKCISKYSVNEYSTKHILLFVNNKKNSFEEIRKSLKEEGIVGHNYYIFICDNNTYMNDFFRYNEYDLPSAMQFLIIIYNKKEGKLYISKVLKPSLYQPMYDSELTKIIKGLGFEYESNTIIKY